MLRIYNALSIIDPLPGLGAKVLPKAKKVEDPIKAFNEGNHKPLKALPLPPPFCKKEAKKAKLATEYASGKVEADVNKAQVAFVNLSDKEAAICQVGGSITVSIKVDSKEFTKLSKEMLKSGVLSAVKATMAPVQNDCAELSFLQEHLNSEVSITHHLRTGRFAARASQLCATFSALQAAVLEKFGSGNRFGKELAAREAWLRSLSDIELEMVAQYWEDGLKSDWVRWLAKDKSVL